jgi:hypothetical protein
VSASAGRRRRKRRLGNSQLLGRSNNINAASQPYKNLTIHITKVNEQSHTTPTKSHQSVVELWLLQARLLRNLRRHVLALEKVLGLEGRELWYVLKYPPGHNAAVMSRWTIHNACWSAERGVQVDVIKERFDVVDLVYGQWPQCQFIQVDAANDGW